jgi:hypothetical protein
MNNGDQPPNIGPGSNYFGSIMSATSSSTNTPGLVAPVQMDNNKRNNSNKPSPHQQHSSPPKPQQLITNTNTNMLPATISLADIDPNSIPANYKIEVLDWFAL